MSHWALFRESFGKLLHPVLLVFGLLAALSGGFNVSFDASGTRPLADLPPGARALLGDALKNNAPTVIAAGLIISLVLLIFATFGQAALLSLINRLENGQRVNVGLGIDDGGRRFLPLLAVKILLALPLILIGAAAAGSVLAAVSGVFSSADTEQLFNFTDLGRLLGLAGVAFLASLLVGGASIGAERAVVLEEKSVFEAIGLGFKLLFSHLIDYLVIGVLFIIVGIALGLLFACVLIPVFLATASFGSSTSGLRLSTDLNPSNAVVALILGLVFGALGSVFTASVWTLAYRQWRPQVVQAPPPLDETLLTV